MNIEWNKKYPDADIFEGITKTKFWVQIAPSTEPDEYAWVIFHSDSGFAQWGGGESTIEMAKQASKEWLIENNETWLITNPKT